jgi:hypothetical protein
VVKSAHRAAPLWGQPPLRSALQRGEGRGESPAARHKASRAPRRAHTPAPAARAAAPRRRGPGAERLQLVTAPAPGRGGFLARRLRVCRREQALALDRALKVAAERLTGCLTRSTAAYGLRRPHEAPPPEVRGASQHLEAAQPPRTRPAARLRRWRGASGPAPAAVSRVNAFADGRAAVVRDPGPASAPLRAALATRLQDEHPFLSGVRAPRAPRAPRLRAAHPIGPGGALAGSVGCGRQRAPAPWGFLPAMHALQATLSFWRGEAPPHPAPAPAPSPLQFGERRIAGAVPQAGLLPRCHCPRFPCRAVHGGARAPFSSPPASQGGSCAPPARRAAPAQTLCEHTHTLSRPWLRSFTW